MGKPTPHYIPPPGTFRCLRCGRRLPVAKRQPDLPAEWESCRACHARGLCTRDKYRNPLSH